MSTNHFSGGVPTIQIRRDFDVAAARDSQLESAAPSAAHP